MQRMSASFALIFLALSVSAFAAPGIKYITTDGTSAFPGSLLDEGDDVVSSLGYVADSFEFYQRLSKIPGKAGESISSDIKKPSDLSQSRIDEWNELAANSELPEAVKSKFTRKARRLDQLLELRDILKSGSQTVCADNNNLKLKDKLQYSCLDIASVFRRVALPTKLDDSFDGFYFHSSPTWSMYAPMPSTIGCEFAYRAPDAYFRCGTNLNLTEMAHYTCRPGEVRCSRVSGADHRFPPTIKISYWRIEGIAEQDGSPGSMGRFADLSLSEGNIIYVKSGNVRASAIYNFSVDRETKLQLIEKNGLEECRKKPGPEQPIMAVAISSTLTEDFITAKGAGTVGFAEVICVIKVKQFDSPAP